MEGGEAGVGEVEVLQAADQGGQQVGRQGGEVHLRRGGGRGGTCTRAREWRVGEEEREGRRASHWWGERAANCRERLGAGEGRWWL